MDPIRFDTLARDLNRVRSRRGALASLFGGTLGLLGLAETTAKHKKHKKKRHPSPASPPSPPASPPAPTCTDTIKNGSETGVDCGGTCPRCANDQGCVSRNDCRSAMCNLQVNICQECAADADCGQDSFGQCRCYTTVQGAKVCDRGGLPQSVASCTLCAAPMNCVQSGSEWFCVRLCGT